MRDLTHGAPPSPLEGEEKMAAARASALNGKTLGWHPRLNVSSLVWQCLV